MLQYTQRLAVVGPWPSLTIDQNECLSSRRYVEQCVAMAAPSKLAEETAIEAIAASNSKVATVNMDNVGCPRVPICDAVVDGTIVRRDVDHVSIPYAAKITRSFDGLLVAVNAFA